MIHILLVEDEKWALEDLINILPWEKSGFAVHTAASAEAAFDIIKTEKIQAVITDIRLKDMTGLDLLHKIKAFNSAIVVVILSAYDTFNYSRDAFLNGAMDYLLKPVEKDELKRILFSIAEIVDRQTPGGGPMPHIASIDKVVASIKEEIRNDLKTRWGLKEFAKKYFVSESYLSREFRRRTNQTITQFIQQTRMQRACELLSTTALSVYEIATQLGYDDYNHFSKLFRREIGLSPTEYRKCNTRTDN